MEGATANNFWREFADVWSPSDKELLLFMEPSASVSAEPVSNQIPKTTDTNLKRQLSGVTRDAAAEKKRMIDRAYRERCKEEKMNTKIKLDALTNENDRLRRENDCLRKEEALLVETLRHQKDEMKQLEKEFGQLKGQLHRQNTVVEVLSKRLAGSNDKDLQRENAQLKNHIDVLTKKMNNPENLNAIQLRAKIAQLENEKHSLQVIVDALCEKINNEKDQLGTQELALEHGMKLNMYNKEKGLAPLAALRDLFHCSL